jgi:hypothetical protein
MTDVPFERRQHSASPSLQVLLTRTDEALE